MRGSAQDDQVRDHDLHGLAGLVQRRRPYLEQPLLRPRPRGSDLQDLTLHGERVAGADRERPAELVEAGRDDASCRLQVALDQQAHGDGRGVPAAGRQPAKQRVPGGLLVEMGRRRP
jgi:hypothetical protein